MTWFLNRRSWGSRRGLSLALFGIAGITAVNVLWLIPALDGVRSSASTLALAEADRLSATLNLSLEQSLENAQGAARAIALEPSRTNITIERLITDNVEFQSVAVVDRSGRELVHFSRSGPLLEQGILADHSHDPFFYLALQGTPNFWDLPVGSSTPEIILAIPLGTGSSTPEVIIATLNLQELVTWGGIDTLGAAGYVVDRDGQVVLSSDPISLPLRTDVSGRQVVEKVITDGREVGGLAAGDAYYNAQGNRMFAVGIPIPISGWGVFVEESEARAFGEQNVLIALAFITWLLGLSIVFVSVRSNYIQARQSLRLDGLLKENYEVGKILVKRDIELTEANARLMALDASKSEFVSIAAHQLRTPVTGIRWAFSMLIGEELGSVSPAQRKVLEEGLRSAIRMADLINDLLNVARIEEGRFGIAPTRRDPRPIIEGALERAHKMAEGKGVALERVVPLSLPQLDLDEEKIAIALDNLLDNAIKYTLPGGSVTLTASIEGQGIRLAISDTGIGVPKDQIDRLFEKFFRADNAERLQTSGSGLGLYVVKNIVEGHGGTIRVKSEENKGTTVVIELPAGEG